MLSARPYPTRPLVEAALCSAFIVICSQISIPLVSGVPITLQTLAIAFAGYYLGWLYGPLSVLVFLLLGLVGLPVFSNFQAGAGMLFGFTGGFLWGFLPMALLAGLGVRSRRIARPDESDATRRATRSGETEPLPHTAQSGTDEPSRRRPSVLLALLAGLGGLALCHLCGVLWYGHLAGRSFGEAFLLVSLPYLVKDIASVIGAYFLARLLRRLLPRES